MSSGILREERNYWCERPVDEAGLLIDAADYFRAFYDAAKNAKRTILLSGWQFDSDVELLRGKDAEACDLPVKLKPFLNALCERNPDLRIHVLAWDFHMIFALEREWMQKLIFHWTTHENLKFCFDSSHVDKGCHHQKFAVIDGQLSFLGGLDLADHRWDDRGHGEENPRRLSRGAPHKPFHDVQTYLVGRDVGKSLCELFTCRWKIAGGEPFDVPGDVPFHFTDYRPTGAVPIPSKRVALSRTDPKGSPAKKGAEPSRCREVLDLYIDAIHAAEKSIYVETQYFSSRDIAAALAERLRAPGRGALDVVIVLNMKAETLKEEIAVGLAQAKVLSDVREAAKGTEHQLGIYYTVPEPKVPGTEPERATYIHSKVMIVDDKFLNIGSANLTNRSCSVDTELNATFECAADADALARCIEGIRLNLLREHVGKRDGDLSFDEGRVASLDKHAKIRNGRIRLHPSPTERERTVIDVIDPQALPFDPGGVEEDEEDRSLFVHGIGALWRRLLSDRDDKK